LPDSPVQEACQADKPAVKLAQVVAVLVLAADPAAVVDPAAAAGLAEAVVADKEAVRVLAVDPVEAVAAVAAAEAVFH
jgi:hypothetical protein